MRRLPSLLLPLLLLSFACAPVVSVGPRNDAPASAAEYHAMRRAGTDDPHREYAKARAAMRRMSRYTTSSEAVDFHGRPLDRWTPLGPGNIGGRTRALIIDPADPRIVYAAGVSGGVWKSYNGGEEWTAIGDEMTNIAVSALVLDPNDHRTLYAGTGEGYYREEVRGTGLPLRGFGMYVTRDAGETWTHLTSTANADFHWVNDLVIRGSDLFAATRTGVWQSSDAGQSWTRALATTVMGGCLDLELAGGVLLASCGTFQQATVYRTTGGTSWQAVLSDDGMGRTSLASAPSNPAIVYAMSASNKPGNYQQGLHAIYRSDDGGTTWRTLVSNARGNLDPATLILTNPVYAQTRNCQSTSQQDQFVNMGWYCNVIAVDPKDPERVWAGGVDLFRSDDGGSTWGVATYWWSDEDLPSFVHADQHRIVFHPGYDGTTNKTMFVANDGGVYRTTDARAETATGAKAVCNPLLSKLSFTPLNRNYGVTQFYHGAVFSDGTRFIGGTQDNGTILGTIEGGVNGWRRVAGGDGGYVMIDPVDESIVYAAYQVGNILKSGPGGPLAFRSARKGLVDNAFLFITPFTLDPNDRNVLWTGGAHLWRSASSAESWSRASAPLPGRVSAIAVAPGNSDRVVAGTHNGDIVFSNAATASTISTQWQSTRPRDGFVSSIAFDPLDANVVYATYAGFGGQHVWRSTDGGATWSARSGNLPDIPVHSLAVDPTRRERLYLGTDLGVFVSLDAGESWQVENTGFAAAVTETVVIAQGARGPAVYAFTHGRGAWRAELVPSGVRRRSVR